VTRAAAVRLILIVAILTTASASAPRTVAITASEQRTLSAGTTRISARANQIAVASADQMVLGLEFHSAQAPVESTATIVRDDPSSAPETLVLTTGYPVRIYQLLALCAHDKDCDAGISVDIPAGSAITVSVTAELSRVADGCFSENSFAKGATVAVAFQP
jgi:hypothetical protein